MSTRSRWPIIGLVVPLVILGVIAGSDRLFHKTVPLEQRLISRNDAIRQKAQQELLGLPAEYKGRIAIRLLDTLAKPDPVARKWATISLALIGPSAQAAIPVLLEQVSDKQKEVAQAARVALTEIGAPDPSQLPSLMEALGDSRSLVHCEAAASIARLGPMAESAIPRLMGYVQSSSPTPVCFIDALADVIGEDEASIERLSDALESDEAMTRRNTVDVFGRLPQKSSSTIRTLLTVLGTDSDSVVRRRAAASLSLPGVPERGLLPALTTSARRSIETPVRRTALEFLHEQAIEIETLQPVLSRALLDQDPDIRLYTLQWIRSNDAWAPRFVKGLLSRLEDPDPRVRRLALDSLSLAQLRGADSLRAVALAQRDSDPLVRCQAGRILIDQGAPERVSISRLTDDLRQGNDPSLCASEILTHAGFFNPDVVPAMIRLLNQPDIRLRARAVDVLLPLGSRAKSALPQLQKAQKEGVPGAGQAIQAIKQAVSRERRRR